MRFRVKISIFLLTTRASQVSGAQNESSNFTEMLKLETPSAAMLLSPLELLHFDHF